MYTKYISSSIGSPLQLILGWLSHKGEIGIQSVATPHTTLNVTLNDVKGIACLIGEFDFCFMYEHGTNQIEKFMECSVCCECFQDRSVATETHSCTY